MSVSPATATVTVGGTTTLSAETRDAAGTVLTGRSIIWSTSASTTATVSSSGVVTGVGAGSVVITATSEGRSGTATITVSPPPVASVTLNVDSADVAVRGTTTLTAVARDAAGTVLTGRPITWTTSSAAVATVSASGVITGISAGTVTISATSETWSATARVRVVTTDLAAIVDSVRQAFQLPALAAAVVTRANGLVAVGVAGTRRIGQALPVTLNDRWHIASNSKSFTALLAALAVKSGRLSWSDLLVSRYPELATIARPEFRTTTIRDLATMRAGITGNPLFAPSGTDAQMRSQVDTWAIQQAPVATPGSYYYSNIAYQMLGEVTARAWGQTFIDAMRERVLVPMGITTAGFGPTTTSGSTTQPSGHSRSGGTWSVCEACDNAWATGSGRMHMTIGDFARFGLEQLRMDVGQSSLLTQAESRALTTLVTAEDATQGYGFGWVILTNPTQRIVTHDGTNGSNSSRALLYLDSGVGFLLTTNAADNDAVGRGAPVAALTALTTRLQSFYATGR